jgi:hypothetical protein
MSQVGEPIARYWHASVWTGTEMLIWGGYTVGAQADGAAYDPATDRWRSLALSPLPPLTQPIAVWTGSEMIVWGGEEQAPAGGVARSMGARYDPSTDTWTLLAAAGAPAYRTRHTAVWTGTEMLVWGGWMRGSRLPFPIYGDGGRYSPAHDTWAPIIASGAPTPRWDHTAVWTGSEMIIFGGSQVGGTAHDHGRFRPYWLTVVEPSRFYGIDDAPLWLGQRGERYRVVAIESGWALVVWEGTNPDWSVWVLLDSRVNLSDN